MASEMMKFEIAILHFLGNRESEAVSSHFTNKPASSTPIKENWMLRIKIPFNKTLRARYRTILCNNYYKWQASEMIRKNTLVKRVYHFSYMTYLQ